MKRQPVAILLSLAVLSCVGCSNSGPDRPETVAAGGKVTYNGKPVEGATVTFVAKKKDGHSAVGVTDSAGKYKLMTFATGDGAVPGSYQVKIVKIEEVPQSLSGNSSDEEKMPVIGPNWRPPKPKSLIPAKYGNPGTSGLTAKVTESAKENVFDYPLTD